MLAKVSDIGRYTVRISFRYYFPSQPDDEQTIGSFCSLFNLAPTASAPFGSVNDLKSKENKS